MSEWRKVIYLSVTNSLTYDQRMHRICESLHAAGYEVNLVGIDRPDPLPSRSYAQHRLTSRFKKGKLFYLEHNIRLFLFLLFRRADLLVANDLDTALPVWLVSKIKGIPRVMDAHEFFTEMKEVITRPLIHKVWSSLEKFLLPRFQQGYTVGEGIAAKFKDVYGVNYEVIRNLPVIRPDMIRMAPAEPFILYQGAVNHGRGFETLIPAMRTIPCKLVVCGDGNFMDELRRLILQEGVKEKVQLTGMLPPAELKEWASKATLGIFLPDRLGANQFLSLPNKFFDNIEAGLPQITCRFPEYESINSRFPVAVLLERVDSVSVSQAVNDLMADSTKRAQMSDACKLARIEYNWQNEEKRLLAFYKNQMGS